MRRAMNMEKEGLLCAARVVFLMRGGRRCLNGMTCTEAIQTHRYARCWECERSQVSLDIKKTTGEADYRIIFLHRLMHAGL